MAKLSTIFMLLVMNLVVVGTASAAVQLSLTNNSTSSSTYLGSDTFFDSITKSGSGTDIVPISLTNTGGTIISAGVLQFTGHVIDLHKVVGSSASILEVGDVTHSSNVTVDSIYVPTLNIAAGSTINFRPVSGGYHSYEEVTTEEVTTPEPISWVIWLLIGLIAVLAYRRRG